MVLKTDFQRSDVNSQDPLNENFTKIDEYIEDTGWIELPLTESFRAYLDNFNGIPKYRRIGKDVEIKGIVQPTTAIEPGGSAIISVLPEEIRPNAQNVCVICQGSGKNTWLAEIEGVGNLKFSRYGASVNAEAASNAWLPMAIRYFIG